METSYWMKLDAQIGADWWLDGDDIRVHGTGIDYMKSTSHYITILDWIPSGKGHTLDAARERLIVWHDVGWIRRLYRDPTHISMYYPVQILPCNIAYIYRVCMYIYIYTYVYSSHLTSHFIPKIHSLLYVPWSHGDLAQRARRRWTSPTTSIPSMPRTRFCRPTRGVRGTGGAPEWLRLWGTGQGMAVEQDHVFFNLDQVGGFP